MKLELTQRIKISFPIFHISNKISRISYRLPIIIGEQKVLLTRNKRLISSIKGSIFLSDIVADEISDLDRSTDS